MFVSLIKILGAVFMLSVLILLLTVLLPFVSGFFFEQEIKCWWQESKLVHMGEYAMTIMWCLCVLSCAYLQAPLTSTILYHFHWPCPCLGVTRSVQSKTYCFHFLTHFSSDQDKIWCDEAIQTEHTENYFWVRFIETREITAAPVVSQTFQSIWMEFGILLRLVGVLNLTYSVYLVHLIFKGENSPYMIRTLVNWFVSNLVWC